MSKSRVTIVEEPKTSRVVRREANNAGIISGVCSGLADYFNINANVLRVLWVTSSFFYGFGIALYILMILILPTDY